MLLFLHSLSSFLSLPPMLASSIFFSPRLIPSSETMVKDNIYRKPPIYRQHGTVLFKTCSSGLVSARCVACNLSVIPSPVNPSSPPFFSEPSPHVVDSMDLHHRAGVRVQRPFHLTKSCECKIYEGLPFKWWAML